MKKYIIIGLVIVVLLIAFFALISLQDEKEIPLVEGLRFGMSPQKTVKMLGDPIEMISNAGDSEKTVYCFQTSVLGQDARITCYFQNDKQLAEVHFRWETGESSLYDQVYECVHSHYSDKRDFFLKSYEETGSETMRVSIGTDNGVTGLFYDIVKDDSSILVTCIDNS